MLKSLELINNKIDNIKDMIVFYKLLIDKLDNEETAYKISKSNFFEYQEELKLLIKIKKDLEVFETLLKYIRFEENYKDYCGHNDVYEYSRITLYCLNDSNIYHNRDKVVDDFNIVRNYILTNKVGDNYD